MSILNQVLQKLSAFHINAGILLLIYFLAINLISFQTMRLDKKKARRGEWRTPESVLFLLILMLVLFSSEIIFL